uniref:L1 transposable element RRM domain-containing protein n=1 Tax=Ursus americanus TaxID=9643 RepID=A0A452QQ64_URSAM
MKVECVPAPITPSTVPSFSPAPPTPPAPPPPTPAIVPAAATNVSTAGVPTAVQRVLEEDESIRTCLSEDAKATQNKIEVEADGQTEENVDAQNLNSRKSPGPAQTAITAPKMWKKPKDRTRTTEEVLEAEVEPKAEEELSGDRVLESEQDKMSQGFHPGRDPSDLKKVKTVEENGEEAEPVRNGAESISEGEGIDANSGSADSSGEGVTFPFKPEEIFEQIIAENFPNLARETNIRVQEAERTPPKLNTDKPTPRHVIVHFANIRCKDTVLKGPGQRNSPYQGKSIRITSDLSTQTWNERKGWGEQYLKLFQRKNMQPRSFIQQGCHSELMEK